VKRTSRAMMAVGLVAGALTRQAPSLAADPVTAAQLAFDEGRRLEDAGDFAAAAARFEESERLDRAPGTALNLANCYEHAGKLASAWRAFRRGAEEGMARGEEKRARRASDLAEKLKARLSTIELRAEGDVPDDEEVRIDGAALDRAEWGAALPVDGGEHAVVARAVGRAEWSTVVRVAGEGQHVIVVLPALSPVPLAFDKPPLEQAKPSAELPAPISATAAPRGAAPAAAKTWTPMRIAAAGSAAVGVVALGFGVGYGVQARNLWSNRQANCIDNYCNDAGYTLTTQASDAATRSTVAFAIGGVGIAAGVALFLLPAGRKDVSVAADASPGGAFLRLRGVF
jgi:hypothetical protein